MRLLTCILISTFVYITSATLLQSAKFGLWATMMYLFFRIIEMTIETFLMPKKSGLPNFKNTPPPPDRPTRQPERPRTEY